MFNRGTSPSPPGCSSSRRSVFFVVVEADNNLSKVMNAYVGVNLVKRFLNIYNSKEFSFSKKSYIPIVVIPSSFRRIIMLSPTIIIFLNESSIFLKDASS